MTGNNINKFVRTNMHLKPWMLSKNTNHLVNKCIERFYQHPDEDGKAPPPDGVKTKTPNARVENKGPVRAFKLAERLRPPATINARVRPSDKVSNLNSDKLLSSVMYKTRHGGISASPSKKMLNKPVNCKIYGMRRYGSSASSSTGSVFRDDRRSQANPSHTSNYLLRSFGTIKTPDLSTSLRPIVANFLPKVRNQHMESNLGSLPNAIELSTVIQADLMDIDSTLKERIAVTRRTLKENQHTFNTKAEDFETHSVFEPRNMIFPRENERYIATLELMNQKNKLKSTNRSRTSFMKLRREASRAGSIASSKKTNRSRNKLKSKESLSYRRDTRRDQYLKRNSDLLPKQQTNTMKLAAKRPPSKDSILNASRTDEVALKTERLLNQARRLNIDTEYLKLMMQDTPRRIALPPSQTVHSSYQIDLQLRKQAEQLAQLQTETRKITNELNEQNTKGNAQAKNEKARTTKFIENAKAKNELLFEPYEYVSQYGVKKAEERSRQQAMKSLQKETLNEIKTKIKDTEKLIFEQSQKTGINQTFKLFPTILQQAQKEQPATPVTPKTVPRNAPKKEPTFMKSIEAASQRPFKSQRQFSATIQKKIHKTTSPTQTSSHFMKHKVKKEEPEVKKSLWSFKGGKVEKPTSKMIKPPAAAIKAAKEAVRNKSLPAKPKEEPKDQPPSYVTSTASATASASAANNIKTSGPFASRINRRLYLNALRKF